MIELAEHIEALLLENDCVIVPGLGGFVGHYTPAIRVAEENHILPPTRIIGFNPSLKMNDGLLAQSYASVYGTSFSDATKRIEQQVNLLLHQLHEEGKVELPNIGELHYSIYGTFSFVPYDCKLTTPYLYGMHSFELKELGQQTVATQTTRYAQIPPVQTNRRQRRRLEVKLNGAYLRNAASVVAALILFFFITTPIENTQVFEENYAQLIPSELFTQLGQNSLVTTPIDFNQPRSIEPKKKITAPVAVKEIKVKQQANSATTAEAIIEVPTPKKEVHSNKKKPAPIQVNETAPSVTTTPVIKKTSKPYHIIVASVSTEQDAYRMAKQLQQSGFPKATTVIGNGKMRVSIQSCDNQQEAYKVLKQIRANELYKSAWVLH